MKILIEMVYQRVPKPKFKAGDPSTHVASTVYNGNINMSLEEANCGMFCLPFENQELQDVAVWLHHAVKLASATKHEFCVMLLQKPPGGSQVAAKSSLNPSQVERLRLSEQSAKDFMAPTIINRGEG